MVSIYDLIKIYECRPFKTRNADEFDISDVLDIFVDPTDGLKSPYDYENVIIKGKMGSGKTMYLRANFAYHLYTIIPCLLDDEDIVLPIYIRLSDFETIIDPTEIYKSIIIKIIKEMTSIHMHFMESEKLANLHNGIKVLASESLIQSNSLSSIISELSKMTSEEYIERTSKVIKGQAGISFSFIDLSAECNKEMEVQIKKKRNAGIEELNYAYEILLKPFNGRLLILFDEAGSLNKAFFKEQEGTSMFEKLMNQLRTLSYVRTKLAVYPQSYSDILTETRYGDSIMLQENIRDEQGYINFENRAISLIEKYIYEFTGITYKVEDIFDINPEQMDILEQIIYASNGNMRRFVHLLDMTLSYSYKSNRGTEKVNIQHVNSAIRDNANSLERTTYSQTEIEFLNTLVTSCRARSTFRFKFPYKSIDLHRYISKSEEYNIGIIP